VKLKYFGPSFYVSAGALCYAAGEAGARGQFGFVVLAAIGALLLILVGGLVSAP
jgi:hypothetical protein